MTQLNDWLGQVDGTLSPISAPDRAALAWRRINRNPSAITIRRGTADLPAQTVRLEANNDARRQDGMIVTVGRQYWTVFGIRDHATLPDTDIERSDRFDVEDRTFEVIALLTPPGEIQAVCEVSEAT